MILPRHWNIAKSARIRGVSPLGVTPQRTDYHPLWPIVQQALFERAVAFRDEHTLRTTDRTEFDSSLEGRPGYVVAPWCGSAACEAKIKTATQATIRNLPLDPPPTSGNCIECGQSGQVDAYFAKSY